MMNSKDQQQILRLMTRHLPPSLVSDYQEVMENMRNQHISLSAMDYLNILDLHRLEEKGLPAEAHWLYMLLFLSLEEGSLALSLSKEDILEKLSLLKGQGHSPDQLDDKKQQDIQEWGERILHFLEREARNLHSLSFWQPGKEQKSAFTPLIVVEGKQGKFLYFQKYLAFWKQLHHKLLTFMEQHVISEMTCEESPLWQSLKAAQPAGRALHEDQIRAIESAMDRTFTIVTGGPGTGKTNIISNLVLLFLAEQKQMSPERMLSRIKIAAPTGRAAKRVMESLSSNLSSLNLSDPHLEHCRQLLLKGMEEGELSGETLHRLLSYNPERNVFGYDERRPLPADLVVVDEVSMVDVQMMSRLLSALSPDTKLVFLGDENQLPSVEAGAVLSSLIFQSAHKGEQSYLKKLTVSFRNEARIKALSDRIMGQETPFKEGDLFSLLPGISLQEMELENKAGGVHWIKKDSREKFAKSREKLFNLLLRQYYLSESAFLGILKQLEQIDLVEELEQPETANLCSQIFKCLDSLQILSLIKEGPAGVAGINRTFSTHFKESRGIKSFWGESRGFYSGAPLLITRNDYQHGLFNGERGLFVEDKTGKVWALFAEGKGFRLIAAESLSSWELSYCMTVHKSQGSEFERILLVLPEQEQNRLLNKQILYTALTRAKQTAYVMGPENILLKAMNTRLERESGVDFFRK